MHALDTLSLLSKPQPLSAGGATGSSSKSAFALARKPLRLVVDEVDEQAPTDIAYVFSGYAPLSVRLVQCAVGNVRAGPGARGGINGWKGIEEVLRGLPGESFELAQVLSASSTPVSSQPRESLLEDCSTVLPFFSWTDFFSRAGG